MTLYETLHQDHEKIRGLFSQLESLGASEHARREQLFFVLFQELDIHTQAEEKFFYSILRTEEKTRETILEALDEHKGIRRMLDELETMDKGTPAWGSRLGALRETVENHVDEEETVLFPLARQVLEDEEAAGIAEDVEFYREEHAEMESY